MTAAENPTIVFVIAVIVGVVAQAASARMRLPPIFLWLSLGMLLGPFGLHILHVETIHAALLPLIELGLAIILFEGGLNLNLKALKEHGSVVGRLLFFGPALTMLIGAWAANMLAGLAWPLALLFGAIIAVGGPTVILPIVRQVRLNREVSHILTSEAMLVDAVGAILAIVMLQLALTPDQGMLKVAQELLLKFFVGGGIGWLGGRLLAAALMQQRWLRDMELRSTFTLAMAWGIFILADSISSQAGLLAVLVAGATLQKMELPDIQRLRHFKGSLSTLLISVLFVLLASSLDLSILEAYLGAGLALFAILAFVARPLIASLSALGTKLSSGQTLFLGAMAPRGVVAAAISSLFALLLHEKGYVGGEIMLALVYIIIIVSVFCYGFLASPLSRWLKVTGGDERSVLIIGGGQIGAELGRVLSDDREVRFLDLNPEAVNTLQRAGYFAVRGNALDPLYLEIAHAEEVGSVLAMTGSSDHNLLIARLAHEDFHVPEVYVALQEDDEEKHSRLLHQLQAKRLFAKPYNFTYWNDQAMRKRLVYEIRTIEEGSPLIGCKMMDARIPHGVQPLAIKRDGKSMIPHDQLIFGAGDEVWMLLRPERVEEGQPLILPPASDNSMVSIKPNFKPSE